MADNKSFQKSANVSLVMQTIRVKKHISRIDISRELGLDRSTITNIVTKLIDKKLLLEVAEGSSVSKGGRKPVLLGINSNFGLILGLEIQVQFYRATLMSLDGTIIWNKTDTLNNTTNLKNIILDVYSNLKDDIESINTPLLGIGIGLPGQINPVEGTLLPPSPFYNSNDNNTNDISDMFDIPVLFDNDANCCAWGVLEQRKENNIQNFLYSIMEVHGADDKATENDFGFGIVVNGDVYYGYNYAAGEMYKSLIENTSIDTDAEGYFNELFDKLSMFVSFLNPSHLFLGGEFITHEEVALKSLKQSPLNDQCEVVFSCHREFEVSFGAASMFIERLFKVQGVEDHDKPELTWDSIIEVRSNRRSIS
ncbi:MAG: ROK family transcriptional regulator [Spirochaetaceae bacterium]